MSRVQLALNVADIDESVSFSSKLFGVERVKRPPGSANFAVVEPQLRLVLIENAAGRGDGAVGALTHLLVEVDSADEVQSATRRLAGKGLDPDVHESTTCCYALQDKASVDNPDGTPWEVYTVLADAPTEAGLGCSTEICAPVASEATLRTLLLRRITSGMGRT